MGDCFSIKPDYFLGKYRYSRRDFMKKTGYATLTGLAACVSCSGDTMKDTHDISDCVFGVVADLHYADKEMAINRYYRESDEKLRVCIETWNSLKPSFVIELGDLIDGADREIELNYLETINSIYSSFGGNRYYILGNHDLATLSKEEFISHSGMIHSYYSFDEGAFHFVVLDANYNRDGSDYQAGNFDWTETYIHKSQQEWLRQDLEKNHQKTTIVFVHQNLHDEHSSYGVKNAPEIRTILEHAGNIRLVLQGHDHKGAFDRIKGIPYVTLKAAVDGSGLKNNAYAMVYIRKDGGIHIKGYGKQGDFEV